MVKGEFLDPLLKKLKKKAGDFEMYREVQPGIRHVNIVFDNGGLGDAIASLPAVAYIAKHHKHIQCHLWIADYFKEFAINCLRDTNVIVRSFSEKDKYKAHFLCRAFTPHKYDNMATHLTDHAFHVLVNKSVGPEDMNYLQPDLSKTDITKFNLPEKYVVMTTGFTAPAREMLSDTVNAVNSYILSKGYKVVFLGKTETIAGMGTNIKGAFKKEIDYTVGLNLIDKTKLLETTKVISNAKTIVGLDNGLLHLGGCTDVDIIGGFPTVEPQYRMAYRNNNLGWKFLPVTPPDSLACRFCQSNWTFTYDHSFTECFHKDYKCLSLLTSELYIEQLEKIL